MPANRIPEGHTPDPDDLYDDRGEFHLHGNAVRAQRERDRDPAKTAVADFKALEKLAASARRRLTGKGELDYEAMTTEEIAALRVVMKREFEAERAKSDGQFRQKVTDDRQRELEVALGLPEGTIHTVVSPPPAEMQLQGSDR